MINVYFADCSFLSDKLIFLKAFENVSLNRQNKINNLLKNEDKYRSLGAGLLLSYCLKKHYGLYECEQVFDVGKNGSPFMPFQPEIFFNVSHSADISAVCIGDKPCGVDIEKIRDINLDVAIKHFSSDEKLMSKSNQGFLEVWTLKEAIIKAAGEKIAGNLNKFSVIPPKGKIEFNNNFYFFTQYNIYDYIISISSLSKEIEIPCKINLKQTLNL